MAVVVAGDEECAGLATADADVAVARRPLAPLPPATRRLSLGQRGERETVDVMHHRPLDLHRVVLLGGRTEVAQVVRRKIDAADERQFAIDDHDLAVHAAKHVDAFAEQALAGVEHVDAHASARHGRGKFTVQVRRAVAVDRHVDTYAALRGFDQNALQLRADLVLEKDEGFQQDFAFRVRNGLEHGREEFLSVFQQLKTIPVSPVKVHRCISTAKGR